MVYITWFSKMTKMYKKKVDYLMISKKRLNRANRSIQNPILTFFGNFGNINVVLVPSEFCNGMSRQAILV